MESSELEKLAEAVLGQIFVSLEASGRHVHVYCRSEDPCLTAPDRI